MSLRKRRDAGFTLPEVLIAVVIIATIATTMVGVVAVVIRNVPSTDARAEDARSMMGLVTWLPQDVDSTPPDGFDLDPSTPSGCTVSPGTNVLRMEWSERTGSTTTTFIASYRHVQEAGAYRLHRIACSGTGAGPYTNGYSINLTADLPRLPSGWAPGQAPVAVTLSTLDDSVKLITFEITTISGKVVRTDSAPKNPAMTLPTTSAPSWLPETPETSVFVNTPPQTTPLAFDVHAGVLTMANLIVSDVDGQPLTVELDPASVPAGWTVLLSSLKMSITPPAGSEGTTAVLGYTVDDQQDGGLVAGTVTVTVVPTTTPTTTTTTTTSTTTTTTTTIPPVCQVLTKSLSVSSVKNVQPDSNNQGGGNVNIGVLKDSVVVSATTNDYCEGLDIRYDSGGSNSPPFVNLTEVADNTWRVTLPGRDQSASETWSDGSHAISFHSANGGTWGSLTLTVT